MNKEVAIQTNASVPVIGLLKNEQLVELLIKHNGIHEGKYVLALELQIALGSFGPDVNSVSPGAIFGVSGIGLLKTETGHTGAKPVDAAIVNPVKKRAVKKSV